MKKIMFNDRYGLTDAVLQGRKTMTRRIIRESVDCFNLTHLGQYSNETQCTTLRGIKERARYKVGEVVAVAQTYKDLNIDFAPISDDVLKGNGKKGTKWGNAKAMKGWTNKMFVRADLMPHQIRITNVRIERLQDISDEDCLREGIEDDDVYECPLYGFKDSKKDLWLWHNTPRVAFESIIDKISGKGTWESNPWVFVYEFEIIE